MSDLLSGLNPAQREAVETIHGPLLVLAGPGSGKTRVLTHRIAYLIEQGVDPWNILAVTFTNKAAQEMRHRLQGLVGDAGREVTMGTFHALCARILRRHIQHLGYDSSFLIYDSDDQRQLVKQVIAAMNLNDKSYRPSAVHGAISRAKNDGQTPKSFRAESYWEEIVGRIYAGYQERLQTNNALDFDDLLLLTVRLFHEVPRVLEAYRRRWQYLHVDEFQDTNLVQYELVRLLGEEHRNVFVVGDIDQCVPPGTLVQTPEGERPIEQVRAGDRVISAAGRGTTTAATVVRAHTRPYAGLLVEVTTRAGQVLCATPNHVCFVRDAQGDTMLYPRLEPVLSANPLLAFPNASVTAKSLVNAGRARALGSVTDTTALFGVDTILRAGRAHEQRWAALVAGRRFVFASASLLRPGMRVPVWQGDHIVAAEIVAVREVAYRGPVYDLDVAELHNYIAGGLVVHNSIYAWRGADYRNVMKFEESFPQARTIALEQNYRSTQTILDAASALIRRNRNRKDKGLWSELGQGEKITVFEAYDENEEAQFIVREIQRLKARDGFRNRDFALMYRTNAQSRALEEAFVRSNLPYVIVGGTRFYERREVKDVMAYLRLLHNPYDSVSLERIINVPARAIGDVTFRQLTEWAARLGIPAFSALALLEETVEGEKGELSPLLPNVPAPFSARARNALRDFYRTLQPILKSLDTMNLPMIIGEVVERTGYREFLRDGTPDGEERWANVVELQNVATQYEHLAAREALPEFLENAALVSDADNVPAEERDTVTLMTLHTAKGLEYPVVFIPGMDNNVLPHSRAQESPEEMEEERRLAYVGITRAKQRLYLIHTFRRATWGRTQVSEPSRFLRELPREALEISRERSKRPAGERRSTSGEEWDSESSSRRRSEPVSETPWTTRRVEPAARQRPAPAAGQFKAGDKVRHERFGEGIVISSTPSGGDEEVVVVFPGSPPKKLLASFAKLTKV